MDKISIKIGNGKVITAEPYSIYADKKITELSIAIEDEMDCIVQDICLIRENPDTGKIEVLVWGDHNDEDYTNKYEIEVINE